jgi:hypothetical protein
MPLKTARRSACKATGLAAGAALLATLLLSCAKRPPFLVPPASGVEAVAGFAAASVRGETADIKGKFAFLFRRPGLGRVEAFDPLGRTVYYMIFAGETAYIVVPRRKVYAEDRPETMVARFLGFALGPGEVLELLSGRWEGRDAGTSGAWALRRDTQDRVVGGEREGVVFDVSQFFPGGGVPRTVVFSRPGTSGRVNILSLEFNPAPRPGAFETPFLRTFERKSPEDILEIKDDAP